MWNERELLTAYLIDGKSARDIALENDVSNSRVRALLAKVGISVPPDKIRDEVCEVIAHRGFGSFAGYIKQRGFQPRNDQATELGVSACGLERHYALLGGLAKQHEQERLAGGDP